MSDNENDKAKQYLLQNHLITVTIFGNYAAKAMDTWDMTLPEIGVLIARENRKRKNMLPWLKLAEFGDVRTAKGSLRHDANVKWITGVEVDHDSGRPIADAIAQLAAAGIRALVYTSPSHLIMGNDGIMMEKWRVLAPTSGPLHPSLRAQLTARLNGVLKGAAAAESFVLSQSYYFGSVDRNPAHQVEIIDGDFIDLADDLDADAVGSPGQAARKKRAKAAPASNAAPGWSEDDIDRLIATACDLNDRGENQWHENMRSAVASLVGKLWSDKEIHERCEPGYGDERGYDDIQKLIDTARSKYEQPELREDPEFAELLGKVEADAAEAGLPPFEPAVERTDDKLKLDDFYAFLPTHQYILRHTGEMWIAAGINAALPKVKIGTKQVKRKKKDKDDADGPDEFDEVDDMVPASLWLDWNRPVAQMSWLPGQGELIKGELTLEGGLKPVEGAAIFNKYQPPIRRAGDATRAMPWLDLIQTVYPLHWKHIVRFMAHRIQRVAEKINHALVMTGSPGIGKDTMLAPLKHGVGAWNFKEASPQNIVSRNNDFMQSTVLRISEARDLGEVNRFNMYETMKTICAAPPDMVRVNVKYVPQYYLVNITGVIITTNYPTDGLYLPPTDRRHYVCGTEAKKDDFDPDYWNGIWKWYDDGGLDDVVAFLERYDLTGFDPKAPPEKTPAFWRLVDGATAPEIPALRDTLDELGTPRGDGSVALPTVITLEMIIGSCAGDPDGGLYAWLKERNNRRSIPHRLETCGYVPVRNTGADDGMWRVGGKRQVVYGLLSATMPERAAAATALAAAARTKGNKV